MKNLVLTLIIASIIIISGCTESLTKNAHGGPAMVHDVYFSLNDNSTDEVQKLIKDCYKYLNAQDGIVFFAAGARVEESKREVNVQDWDVALHIVFNNKESHDKYQVADDHHKFIDENKQNWKTVKVFDSFVTEN